MGKFKKRELRFGMKSFSTIMTEVSTESSVYNLGQQDSYQKEPLGGVGSVAAKKIK